MSAALCLEVVMCHDLCLYVCGHVGAPCSVLFSPPAGNLAHMCPAPCQVPIAGGGELLGARMGQPTDRES